MYPWQQGAQDNSVKRAEAQRKGQRPDVLVLELGGVSRRAWAGNANAADCVAAELLRSGPDYAVTPAHAASDALLRRLVP